MCSTRQSNDDIILKNNFDLNTEDREHEQHKHHKKHTQITQHATQKMILNIRDNCTRNNTISNNLHAK